MDPLSRRWGQLLTLPLAFAALALAPGPACANASATPVHVPGAASADESERGAVAEFPRGLEAEALPGGLGGLLPSAMLEEIRIALASTAGPLSAPRVTRQDLSGALRVFSLVVLARSRGMKRNNDHWNRRGWSPLVERRDCS